MEVEAVRILTAGFMMAIGVSLPAFSMGLIASKTFEAIGRNPSIKDDVFTKMVVAMALVDSLAIYCLVVSLILLFAV
ncbi:MAG: ATP synthase F0 subunit C [Candidatus Kerfeldbacteria bacterium]|nr:ATP synthase F0 subunit C [Candidatus Kerfeldbacteria bacterium]